MYSRTGVAFGIALVVCGIAVGFGQPNRPDPWKQWEFLVGEWVGEGTVEVAFEMAPPGQQAFTPYTKGKARRK